MKNIKYIICLVVSGLFLTACKPTDQVYVGDTDMVVYSVKSVDKKCGKYIYYITDSVSNWTLCTNDVFRLGDLVVVVKKN